MTQRKPEEEGRQQDSLENYTAEQQERITALAKKMEVGLENEEQVAGYLGVSVEALDQLVREGRLPDPTEGEPRRFFPAPETAPDWQADEYKKYDNTAVESAKTSAESEAQVQHVLRQLGLDEHDVGHQLNILELLHASSFDNEEPERILHEYEARGIPIDDVKKAVRAAEKRSGVVVSIDKAALERLQMEETSDQSGRELHLEAPEGVRLEDIVGVEPMSQSEWDALKRYQDLADQREQTGGGK